MTSRLPDFLKSRPQAGIDGCPDGWICVYQDSSQPNGVIKSSIIELIDFLPEDTRIAIDIPIGLTDKGPRQCDRAARRFLGSPRNASVFSAPIRPVLQAKNYKEALALHRQADGRGMSKQAYNIMSKIREVDAALRKNRALQQRVREVHPEISFSLWNNGRPMQHNKKTIAGKAARQFLIDREWPGARKEITAQLKGYRYGEDDLHDAFACLWSARRITLDEALCLPEEIPFDSQGLPMAIRA